MSAQGNLDWIAAKVGDIERQMRKDQDKRLEAFTSLLSSIESSLADVVQNIESGKGDEAIKTMAEAIGKLQIPAPQINVNVSPTPITVSAAEQPAPQVNVQVSPTPVTIENKVPQSPAPVVNIVAPQMDVDAVWELRIPGVGFRAEDRVVTIKRISNKLKP
jgi:hypothetical protein